MRFGIIDLPIIGRPASFRKAFAWCGSALRLSRRIRTMSMACSRNTRTVDVSGHHLDRWFDHREAQRSTRCNTDVEGEAVDRAGSHGR